MITKLGYFPLQLVIFPYETLRLHIFEPRYIQLIKDHKDGSTSFCLPTVIDGQLMSVGGLVRVKQITKTHDDGKMDIIVESTGLCKLLDYQAEFSDKLYAGGEVKTLTLDLDGGYVLKSMFKEKILKLYETTDTPLKRPFTDEPWTSLDYGHLLGFSLEQEYTFLTIPKENDRLRYGILYIEELLVRVNQMKTIKNEASLNGEYRSFPSPEID